MHIESQSIGLYRKGIPMILDIILSYRVRFVNVVTMSLGASLFLLTASCEQSEAPKAPVNPKTDDATSAPNSGSIPAPVPVVNNPPVESISQKNESGCQPGNCPKHNLTLKAVDAESRTEVTSMDARENINSAWVLEASVDEDEERVFGYRADVIPNGATVSNQDGFLVIKWTPAFAGSTGSATIVARDVTRCKALSGSDSIKLAACADMTDKTVSTDFETSKNFPYQVAAGANTAGGFGGGTPGGQDQSILNQFKEFLQ